MKHFIHKQYTNILTYFPLGWTWRLYRIGTRRGAALVGWR